MTRSLRIALAALTLAPFAIRAQETAPAATPQAPAKTAAIEEIVVTAQKRVENVQDIPVSVVAIGGDDVARLKLTDTNDLAGLVPNLQANQINGDGTPVFSLRGVTMNDEEAEKIIRKVIKSNTETLAVADRPDTKTRLEEENRVLDALLPKRLDVDAIVAALQPVAAEIKAAKSEGQATGVAMKHLKASGSTVGGKDVQEAVKKIRA